MRRRRIGVVVLLLFAAACGHGDGSPRPVADQATTTLAPAEPLPSPPALHVRGGGEDTTLLIWASCWQSPTHGVCGDGQPPENPVDIGRPAEVEVVFAAPGWRFTATAVPTGKACGREQRVDLAVTGATTHRLPPIGKAGDYTITLNGRSTPSAPNQGDVAATFRWHTTAAGPTEAPSATVSASAARPEDKLSFAGELSARALGVPTAPGTVKASVAVTSSTGAAMTFDFAPDPRLACVPEGSLSLRSDDQMGRQLGALGAAPFRYDVTLVLAGVTYRGTGTWPTDVLSECSPCTKLRFSPPLPAL